MRRRHSRSNHPAFGRVVARALAATAVVVTPVAGVAQVGVEVASAAPAQEPVSADQALADARTAREGAEGRLASLSTELGAMNADVETRFAGAAELAADLEAARREMRRSAVVAYVNGGVQDPAIQVLAGVDLAEASGRATFASSRTRDWSDAAAAFQRLKDDNDPKLVALVERREALASRVDDARDAVFQSAAVEADAERASAAAQRAAAQRAAELAAQQSAAQKARRLASEAAAPSRPARPNGGSAVTAAPLTPIAPSAGIVPLTELSAPLPDLPPGGPSEEAWASVRRCESGGNYRAVSRSGRYRGAYQFDQQTWASMGGRGDPAGALPIEQDARAKWLYAQRGARAWPHCGRALIA